MNNPFGSTPGAAPMNPMPQQYPQINQPMAPTFYPWPGAQNFMNQQPSIPAQPQMQKPVGLPGKMVSSASDITPNDVPMDGRVSLFPQQDYSCIIAKAWNAEGKIDTVVYVPQQPEKPAEEGQNGSAITTEDLFNMLQNLQDAILNLPKTPGEDSLKSLQDSLSSRLDAMDQTLNQIANQKPSNLIVPGGKG